MPIRTTARSSRRSRTASTGCAIFRVRHHKRGSRRRPAQTTTDCSPAGEAFAPGLCRHWRSDHQPRNPAPEPENQPKPAAPRHGAAGNPRYAGYRCASVEGGSGWVLLPFQQKRDVAVQAFRLFHVKRGERQCLRAFKSQIGRRCGTQAAQREGTSRRSCRPARPAVRPRGADAPADGEHGTGSAWTAAGVADGCRGRWLSGSAAGLVRKPANPPPSWWIRATPHPSSPRPSTPNVSGPTS